MGMGGNSRGLGKGGGGRLECAGIRNSKDDLRPGTGSFLRDTQGLELSQPLANQVAFLKVKGNSHLWMGHRYAKLNREQVAKAGILAFLKKDGSV